MSNRKGNAIALRWDDIDRTAGEIRIRDAKTGARRIPLTPPVKWVLAGIPLIECNPRVIAGQNPGEHLKNLDQMWLRLRPRAGLGDVRIHDVRHSWSRVVALQWHFISRQFWRQIRRFTSPLIRNLFNLPRGNLQING